jgi:hypothetical protein
VKSQKGGTKRARSNPKPGSKKKAKGARKATAAGKSRRR